MTMRHNSRIIIDSDEDEQQTIADEFSELNDPDKSFEEEKNNY